jgi:hypothetical protein
MSDLRPLSGEERKSNFGAAKSVNETLKRHERFWIAAAQTDPMRLFRWP